MNAALAKLAPGMDLASLKTAIGDKRLGSELFLIGQDGSLDIVIRAQVRDATGKWIDTKSGFDARVSMVQPTSNPAYVGLITTTMTPGEVTKFFTNVVQPIDFMALRTEPVRGLYGEKSLANVSVLDLVIRELGITNVVLVPQELLIGFALKNLPQ